MFDFFFFKMDVRKPAGAGVSWPALTLGVAAALALLLAPSPARAGDNACGALSSNAATCSDQAYTDGISYDGDTSPVSVTIPGGMSTTITSANNNGWWSAIAIRTPAHASADRSIDLNVGTTGNAVAIRQGSNTSTNSFYNHMGIMAIQRAAGTIDIDVGSSVTIGTSTSRMRQHGIYAVLAGSNAPTIAGAMTITSGATIYAGFDSTNTGHGIYLANIGPGASTVTNTGAIDATGRGIFVDDFGSAGAVRVTNSGAITAAGTGIRAEARGTGKDAAGTNLGVTVIHSAGAITSSGAQGIQALVGTSRGTENEATGSGYVAPMNTGTAKVEVTGGSISAQQNAIEAINFEAGGVDVDVAAGLTSSAGSGIYAVLTDAGNTAGVIDVDNAGDITAAVTGIRVRQRSTANTGSISVDNDGALKKTGSGTGHGIWVQQSGSGGVTIDNTGAIGDATTQHQNGIWLVSSGSGDSTVTNSGAIRASQRGILVQDIGSGGAISVTNSGAITTSDAPGIFAQTTGKDTAGTNAGVSIIHSGGAITTSSAQGIQAWVGAFRSESNAGGASYVAPENTGTVKIEVTGGSIRAGDLDAIEAINYEAGGIDIDVSSDVMVTSWAASGIYAGLTDVGNTAGGIDVNNKGDITAAAAGIWIWQNVAANTASVSVTNEGAIEKTGADAANGIFIEQSGSGDVTVMNRGAIGDATTRHESGIRVSHSGAGAGGVSVTNSGAVMATEQGIRVEKAGTSGDISVTTTGGSITSANSHGIHTEDNAGHTGSVTVANAGDVTAELDGIHVVRLGSGDVSVTNSGGTVTSETMSGIRAENKADDASDVMVKVDGGAVRSNGRSMPAVSARNRGTGDVTVSIVADATLISKQDAGVYAHFSTADNSAGQVKVTQGGAISGRTGVLAEVTRQTSMGETRAAAAQPLIDVTWTGTFADGNTAQTAANDNGRFAAATAAEAVALDRDAAARQALRYGTAAGIEAQVLAWKDMATEVAAGDAPATITDNAMQMLAVPTGATAADNAYVAQFKAALENDEIEVDSTLLSTIDTDGTTGLSDAEIVTYLQTNDDATRTLLRNILAQGLSEKEKEVLEAVATNTGLDAALNDADAGFSDAYKAAVRGLLDRYNIGNIHVAVNGGSIASRGDGIRAYYATPNANNGAIDVTVGKGASVSGAVAGIWVANAGSRVSVTNEGMIRGGEVGIEVTGVSTVTTSGMSRSNAANVGSGGVQVVNRGTITGPVGIRVPAGSTVENYGTILSTDILIDFQGTGTSVVRMYRGAMAAGTIQLDGRGGDLVDLSDMYIGDVNVKIELVEATDDGERRRVDLGGNYKEPARERPVTEEPMRPVIKEPTMMRPGDMLVMDPDKGRMMGINISGFALTDDMLSDLTGSIHGAIVETQTGMRPGAASAGGQVVWATPFGGARDQNGSGDVADATHYFGGGLVGTSWGAKDIRVGGFLGGSVGQLDVGRNQGGQSRDVDMQTIFGGLVASRTIDTVLYDARLLFGRMTHDSTRRGIPGMDTAEVEYSSLFLSPEVGVSTDVALMSRLHVLPRLRVRYAGLFTQGFREHKRDWDVQYEKRTLHLVEGRAEVGVPFALDNGGQINPRVGVEGRWLLAGSKIKGMALGDMPFSREAGGDDAVFTGTVGVGMSVPVAEATTLVGSFDGALTTEEAWRALGYLGLTYSF